MYFFSSPETEEAFELHRSQRRSTSKNIRGLGGLAAKYFCRLLTRTHWALVSTCCGLAFTLKFQHHGDSFTLNFQHSLGWSCVISVNLIGRVKVQPALR